MGCCLPGGKGARRGCPRLRGSEPLRVVESGAGAPRMSNTESWRGVKKGMWPKHPTLCPGRALERLGCHAPGDPVGALTSYKFHLDCHQLWRKLLHRDTCRLGRGWSLGYCCLLTNAGASPLLTPPSSPGAKNTGSPSNCSEGEGLLPAVGSWECPRQRPPRAKLVPGLHRADSQQDWSLLTPKGSL